MYAQLIINAAFLTAVSAVYALIYAWIKERAVVRYLLWDGKRTDAAPMFFVIFFSQLAFSSLVFIFFEDLFPPYLAADFLILAVFCLFKEIRYRKALKNRK